MSGLSLVMPMAGRGSRFVRNGVATPKPLIGLFGRPFFWWAAESVRQAVPVEEMVFVVLAEHVDAFGIDRAILDCYPQARIIVIPEVTSGAAETASTGVAALSAVRPFAINDCDHAFRPEGMTDLMAQFSRGMEGALLGFRADSPAYSYVKFDDGGRVCGTVEKVVAGPFAIAGCYLFANPRSFFDRYERYKRTCPYDELFVSGIYDAAAKEGAWIGFSELAAHVSFGTPEEEAAVARSDLAAALPDRA